MNLGTTRFRGRPRKLARLGARGWKNSQWRRVAEENT